MRVILLYILFAKFAEQKKKLLDDVVETLYSPYFSSYGYSFPLTGTKMFSQFLSTEGEWWINNSFSCLQRLWVISNCCYMCHFSWLFLDERKMDHVFHETGRNRQMANQIAYRTFAAKGVDDDAFPAGPKVCQYRTLFSPWIVFGVSTRNCS